MRLVILEGPDGSGKSTLAKQLTTLYGFNYVHCGVPEPGENLFRAYSLAVLKAIRSKRDTVIDRLHLGETIYGPVMRGEDTLGRMGCDLIERVIHSVRGRVVICLPKLTTCIGNWAEKRKDRWDPKARTGDYVDAESKIIDIWSRYQSLTTEIVRYLHYDYESNETKKVVWDYMLNWTGEYGSRSGGNPFGMLPVGVIGSPTARYLVVGEQVNLRKTKVDLPFYELGASSKYLYQAIRMAGLGESELAFCNAVTPAGTVTDGHRHRRKSSGHRNLKIVAESLPLFVRAIALGKTAARVCQESGIPFISIPHPAYWMRFNRLQHHEYSNKLVEVTSQCGY